MGKCDTTAFVDGYYEQSALWGRTYSKRHESERVDVITSLIPEDVRSILDAGCGDGVLANNIHKRYRVVALDYAAEPLRHVIPSKIKGSIHELPFPDKCFDLVVSAEVLEHLPHRVYKQALHELQRISRRYIMISVPNLGHRGLVRCGYCACVFSVYRHLRLFNMAGMSNLFATFHLESVSVCGPLSHRHYNKVLLTLRLITRGWPEAPNAICPQCGKTGSPRRNPLAHIALSGLNRILPPRRRKRKWIVALYRRTET